MNVDPNLTAALIAGGVSIVVGLISYFSNKAATRHQVQQDQFKDILAKRMDLYPKLWRIHIMYETNWVLEGKPKTRKWAEEYFSALNDFNLEGGVFFSEGLYTKFAELRFQLYHAIRETEPDKEVSENRAEAIRSAVYGGEEPGLSTYEKDDLGSYRPVSLQKRVDSA